METASTQFRLVDELLIHIAHHFKHEEKMLREIRFPRPQEHA